MRAPDPICVDCGQAYPIRGPVTQVTRCESCQTTRVDPEHEDRLRRIETAAPPASSFEGRVQQWRDEREDFDVEWDGTKGHDGKSITSGEGLGSTLSGHSLTLHKMR